MSNFLLGPNSVIKNKHDVDLLNYIYNEHLAESRQDFKDNQIVCIALQGSQNYGLDTENSDVDTKLITIPSLDELIFNRKPVSTTHVRANNEHIDYKDLRLMFQTFRKQNLNFIEILFTDYLFINEDYFSDWSLLLIFNEEIARYNPHRAVATMCGVANEKYTHMEHPYPNKMELLAKYGYDGKQLCHLVRVSEFLTKYTEGCLYKDCLKPNDPQFLIKLKQNVLPLNEARELAKETYQNIQATADIFLKNTPDELNPTTEELLNDIQSQIMTKAIRKGLTT